MKSPIAPTPTQLAVLRELARRGGQALSRDIYNKMAKRRRKSSLYTQVCWARQRGWIDARRHDEERRCYVYTLTPAGREAMESRARQPEPKLAELGWKLRQRAALVSILALASSVIDRQSDGGLNQWESARDLAARGLGLIPAETA